LAAKARHAVVAGDNSLCTPRFLRRNERWLTCHELSLCANAPMSHSILTMMTPMVLRH
jgi:hypothetical protein